MRREWVPSAVAGGIAILLVWLAGDPLALRPQDVEPGGGVWWGGETFLRVPNVKLHEPLATSDSFPQVFRWAPVEGALEYEITVGPDERDRPPLFRQRGPGNSLEVALESGAAPPPPGAYVWEVRALRNREILARGVARFQVRPSS